LILKELKFNYPELGLLLEKISLRGIARSVGVSGVWGWSIRKTIKNNPKDFMFKKKPWKTGSRSRRVRAFCWKKAMN